MTTLSTFSMRSHPPAVIDQRPQSRICVMQITWSLVAGGAEVYAMTVASGLDPSRYRVLMCGVDQGGALESEIARRSIACHIMHRRAGIDWRLMWRMFALFRRENVQVIHTHHFNQLFYSIAAAKLLGIRIIHTEHSIEAYRKRRLRWALKLMSSLCHRLTVIGADGYQVLRQRVGVPASRLEIIRAAVDIERFNVNAKAARAELGLAPDDRVAAIVARLYPEKNHMLLLEAFRQVANWMPAAKLLIAGDGVQEQSIRACIAGLGLEEHVRMLGVRRDIPRILAASDAFVLCSDREGLPIAVLEAMAAGRPVIATAVGDLPLVVQDGRTGMLVPRGDPQRLASALCHILQERALAAQMGEAGRQLVQSEYSLEQLVRRHQALYGEHAI